MSLYSIDEYGRAVLDSRGLFELWFQGIDETGLSIKVDDDIMVFNQQCVDHDKSNYVVEPDTTPPVPHEQRIKQWMIPEQYQALDVETWCLSLCADDEERLRVRHEMRLFELHGMIPVLRYLIHMINVFREQKIVWGIGRGSSVASFVLFLIGVHKINPLKYGLNVEDFLR